MTRLCASILVRDLASAKRDIADAIEAGAEMVELRMDTLPDAVIAADLNAICSVPCIFTCRAECEGGQSDLSDLERLDLLEKILQRAVETTYVDFEMATSHKLRKQPDPNRLIISSHDYTGRPARLYNLLEEMNESPAAVNKVAWKPRSIRDCQEAFELLQTRSRPTIAICMGAHGAITRILAKKFGGFLTFAAVRDEAQTAPGQPTIEEMKEVYRWDSITPETKVYGVVGSPIAHSMSPAIHNAAFDHGDIDAVYVPLLVNEGYESFKAFMETFVVGRGPLLLDGLSITIPHKENALRYLKERGDGVDIEHLARTIGAVNTIVVTRDANGAHLAGRNTDYAAILDSICAAIAIEKKELETKRVAVIGAGGTGRTAVAALAAIGATVVVYNRTIDRAEEVAQEFNGTPGKVMPAPMEKLCDSSCDIYINTTSLGMHPDVNESPFDPRPPAMSKETLVFDTIYNPTKTKLLQQAETAGAKTIGGIEMFVRQGAAQFEMWTGQPAPVDVMRNAMKGRLAAADFV